MHGTFAKEVISIYTSGRPGSDGKHFVPVVSSGLSLNGFPINVFYAFP